MPTDTSSTRSVAEHYLVEEPCILTIEKFRDLIHDEVLSDLGVLGL